MNVGRDARQGRPDGASFDGFISYSHAADDLLAPRLQSGLQRFAKPWWRRRALRIFRDESSLSANPHLWSSITEALDGSSWFVLLLSENAASSEWVNREVAYWVEHKDPSRIIPVVTDGEFGWAEGDVWASSTVAPPALAGAFSEEPRWVDLRWARSEEQLDLSNPRFSDAVADIASAIRGIPKDELESEEVRQHRRTIRTAWAAGALVLLLGVAATIGAIVAVGQSNEAQSQRDEAQRQADIAEVERDRADENAQEASAQAVLARSGELWASAALALESDAGLAALLGLSALDVAGSPAELGGPELEVLWRALREDRALLEIEHGHKGQVYAALSDDGSLLAVSSEEGTRVIAYAAPAGEVLWEYVEETADSFSFVWLHPDASRVAVGIRDSASGLSNRQGLEPDDLPNRVVVLNGSDGSVVEVLEFEGCVNVDAQGWSADGAYFLLSSGVEPPCERADVEAGAWVEVLDGTSFESVAVIPAGFGSIPVMDDANRLFVLNLDEDTAVLDPPTFSERRAIEASTGLGDVSPDGSLIAVENRNAPTVRLIDVESGRRVDLLDPQEFVFRPLGLSFSPDGTLLIGATTGDEVVVWSVFEGTERLRLPGGPARSTAMSSDGSVLYTAHADGVVRAWDLTARNAGMTVLGDVGDHEWVHGNSFEVGSEFGAFTNLDFGVVDNDPLVRVFDAESGELVGATPGWLWGMLDDGRFLLVSEGEWFLHDPGTGESTFLVGCIEFRGVCVDSGEPGEGWFLWTTIDGGEIVGSRAPYTEMHVIDPDTGALMSTESTYDAAFGVAATGDDWFLGWTIGEFVAFERGSGELLYTSRQQSAPSEVSHGLDRLAIWVGGEPVITLIDLETWEATDLRIRDDRVRGMAFSPDDTVLAVGALETLAFYELATGDVVLTIPIDGVSDIHWLDEDTVVVGTWDGAWLGISLDPADLVTSVRDGLRRSFTDEECAEYRIDPCPTLEEMRDR